MPTGFRRGLRAQGARGAALVTALLVVLVLTVLGIGAMMTTATELRIASNDRSSKEAFYIAEAGVEDARSRLQATSPYPIPDALPASQNWAAFIGTLTRAEEKGYQGGNSSHFRYDKLDLSPLNLDYAVAITHKVVSNQVLKWGDNNSDGRPEENTTTGSNIYVINSTGQTPTGASKIVKIECARMPPVTVPAALYTKADTTIQGSSTNVIGNDGCGASNLAGIITQGQVRQNGGPTIEGSPAMQENSPMNLDVPYMIEQFKGYANYSYNVNSATMTGMAWGVPTPGATQQSPSNCSAHNVVKIDTSGTYVKLSGGTTGCGLLLIEGDLNVQGGFEWYGVILVTGSVTFTGGGGKNVTGAILSGGSVSADLVGGDANLIFCSQAVSDQSQYLPLVTLRWVEMFN